MNLIPRFIRNSFRKSFGQFTFYNGNGPTWNKRDYANFANETYLKNVIAFRCIDMIAKSVSSVEWGVKRKLGDGTIEDVPGHPLSKILKRANPTESFAAYMLKKTAYLLIDGNTYSNKITLETGPNKGETREIYCKRPDQMNAVLDDGRLTAYQWRPGGVVKETFPIDPITYESDLLHVKLFNPLDEIYGAAITEAVAREVDTSNEAINWNKSLLENSAKPGMVFESQEQLSDTQFKRLKKQLIDKYSGSGNAGRNLILEGATAKKYSLTPDEMDWNETSRELARRISFGWGVPAILIGIPGDLTFKNYPEARLSFWEETVFYYLQLFKSELNRWLLDEDDEVFLDYSLDKIPAMVTKRAMLFEMLKGVDFLKDNEKRNIVGLEDTEGGDTLYKPLNLIPVENIGDLPDDQS